jgi:hydrogenase maturation protease
VTDAHTLVAGIGNVFLSDDGFGVEVARRLSRRDLPDGVRAEDYGIRGIHLAYELLEGYELLVLVDAVPLAEPPGTLALIEPAPRSAVAGSVGVDAAAMDAHTMSPDVVLDTLARLGGKVDHVVIVGCQPAVLREGMGLSPHVEAAVDAAAELTLEVTQTAHPARAIERRVHS